MELKDKIKDKVEIPVFKRCCCCFPLRYGLLAWTYFKIIVDIFFIPVLAYYLMIVLFMLSMIGKRDQLGWIFLYITLFIFAVVILLTDIIMSIVFIVGGHQKKVNLLRVFYIYSIVILVVTILLITFSICLSLTNIQTRDMSMHSWDILLVIFSAYFAILILQSYYILLMRSEIIKLRDSAESFKFVNNAAEAECTMICKEKVDTVIPTEDVEIKDV